MLYLDAWCRHTYIQCLTLRGESEHSEQHHQGLMLTRRRYKLRRDHKQHSCSCWSDQSLTLVYTCVSYYKVEPGVNGWSHGSWIRACKELSAFHTPQIWDSFPRSCFRTAGETRPAANNDFRKCSQTFFWVPWKNEYCDQATLTSTSELNKNLMSTSEASVLTRLIHWSRTRVMIIHILSSVFQHMQLRVLSLLCLLPISLLYCSLFHI